MDEKIIEAKLTEEQSTTSSIALIHQLIVIYNGKRQHKKVADQFQQLRDIFYNKLVKQIGPQPQDYKSIAKIFLNYWKFNRFAPLAKNDTNTKTLPRINIQNNRIELIKHDILPMVRHIISNRINHDEEKSEYNYWTFTSAYIEECIGNHFDALKVYSDLISTQAIEGIQFNFLILKAAILLLYVQEYTQATEYLEFVLDDFPSHNTNSSKSNGEVADETVEKGNSYLSRYQAQTEEPDMSEETNNIASLNGFTKFHVLSLLILANDKSHNGTEADKDGSRKDNLNSYERVSKKLNKQLKKVVIEEIDHCRSQLHSSASNNSAHQYWSKQLKTMKKVQEILYGGSNSGGGGVVRAENHYELWEILAFQALDKCEYYLAMLLLLHAYHKYPESNTSGSSGPGHVLHYLLELYYLTNQRREAMRYAERAFELRADSAELRDLLILINSDVFTEKFRFIGYSKNLLDKTAIPSNANNNTNSDAPNINNINTITVASVNNTSSSVLANRPNSRGLDSGDATADSKGHDEAVGGVLSAKSSKSKKGSNTGSNANISANTSSKQAQVSGPSSKQGVDSKRGGAARRSMGDQLLSSLSSIARSISPPKTKSKVKVIDDNTSANASGKAMENKPSSGNLSSKSAASSSSAKSKAGSSATTTSGKWLGKIVSSTVSAIQTVVSRSNSSSPSKERPPVRETETRNTATGNTAINVDQQKHNHTLGAVSEQDNARGSKTLGAAVVSGKKKKPELSDEARKYIHLALQGNNKVHFYDDRLRAISTLKSDKSADSDAHRTK